jgi:hypothetical protein
MRDTDHASNTKRRARIRFLPLARITVAGRDARERPHVRNHRESEKNIVQ